jgi:hypothetical protein
MTWQIVENRRATLICLVKSALLSPLIKMSCHSERSSEQNELVIEKESGNKRRQVIGMISGY